MSVTISSNPAGKKIYYGIFFVALATLMYEILLTRIFSVTMGYHFAFMAVSLAMFGMTAGAIYVYICKKKYDKCSIEKHLAVNALWFSVTIILSFLLHLFIPFVHTLSLIGFLNVAFTYSVISVPFIFSGICVSLILTRYSQNVNKLYAADLIGASLGCILVVLVINYSGGPTAVFFSAFLASIGAIAFAADVKMKRIIIVFSLLVLCFASVHTYLVSVNHPLLRVYYVRGEWKEKPLFEKWNSFSRVSVDGDSTKYEVPFGWGLSNMYDRNRKIRQLMLNVDAFSTTVLSKFNGDTSSLNHLRYDVSNMVHYLRPQSDIMVIGSGAGRDVLSSLAFGQKSILGIEINKDMITALNENFGGFTGHLDKYPNVKFVGDEARSYIQRHQEKFDIIQVSVIDNWSASSSGTFVLTENALYTTETWKLLFDRLKPNGILTVTRFYRIKPAEIYRLTSISAQVLKESGIKDIREHLVILKCDQQEREADKSATGTILLSKQPFTDNELKIIDSVSSYMHFIKVLTPNNITDSAFAFIASSKPEQINFIENFPLDISPPTDDKPFFFHLLNFKDIVNKTFWKEWDMGFNVKAMAILLALSFTMLILTLCCILIPLKLTSKDVKLKHSKGLFIFFAAIGFGFMLVEISQLQRLNIFLGHPTYSITVSLFTLLISSGIGSYISGKFINKNSIKSIRLLFILLLLVLILFGSLTPGFISLFRETETYIRVIIAALILFPLGLFMGTAFPIGMKFASLKDNSITPWLWGINGVMSVFASVVSIIISMSYGISTSYWSGFICYLIAFLSIYHILKHHTNSPV